MFHVYSFHYITPKLLKEGFDLFGYKINSNSNFIKVDLLSASEVKIYDFDFSVNCCIIFVIIDANGTTIYESKTIIMENGNDFEIYDRGYDVDINFNLSNNKLTITNLRSYAYQDRGISIFSF
jgi:hypothetical protein